MYDSVGIVALATSRALLADANTNGTQIVAVSITGGTGTVDIEGTLTPVGVNQDFSNAIWISLKTITSGTDDILRTGPFVAFRANGASLTAGTAVIEVRQASRV